MRVAGNLCKRRPPEILLTLDLAYNLPAFATTLLPLAPLSRRERLLGFDTEEANGRDPSLDRFPLKETALTTVSALP
jgi:hypothetical protein